MPKTFDPGDFDIHEFEKQKPDVQPITKSEMIDPRVLKQAKPEPGEKPWNRKALIALVGNVFLPGLGNVMLKKTALGAILLLLNLALLAITLSPTSMLGYMGDMACPGFLPAYSETPIVDIPIIGAAVEIPPCVVGEVSLAPERLPVIYLGIGLAFIAWTHFFYLLMQKK